MNTNNKTQATESGLIANDSPEMKIVDMPMMTMPTVGQIATVLGNKLDEKVIAPMQLTAEEIAMNVRAAGNAMSQDGRGRGVAAGAAKLGAGVVAVAAMVACEKDPIQKENQETPAQLAERLHVEAEAYANSQGWSQGVVSLAAGVIDYYYYYPKQAAADAKQPLIRLSYQVDVDDFIAKIEADAKNRGGIYDPKTEGKLWATAASLEGDNKNYFWSIPVQTIYDAKSKGLKTISYQIGEFPANVPNGNTIGKEEGLNPNKKMQIYASYGNQNWKTSDEIVVKPSTQGPLKDIL